MDWWIIVMVLAAFILFYIGWVIGRYTKNELRVSGNIVLDKSDPDGMGIYLELKILPDELAKKDYVYFKVSQK